jgi:D-alanyl-D-alanine carboxypeptidase
VQKPSDKSSLATALALVAVLASCSRAEPLAAARAAPGTAATEPAPGAAEARPSFRAAQSSPLGRAFAALDRSGLPTEAAAAVKSRAEASSSAFLGLLGEVEEARAADPGLFLRADGERALSESFEPTDLRELDGTGLSLSRGGHRLRAPALAALLEMDAAARKEGVLLLVSSSYRSYAYQAEVFARNAAEVGEERAARDTARPGRSQHQLGTALDFGSIDDSFAQTKAGLWLAANAARFGFSLSYPRGMEAVTGYTWESWHYRYLGKDATRLEAEYFGGIQQYLLRFLEVY